MLLAALLSMAVPLTGADLRSQVAILRDEWGVPHIYGKTDASVVYGLVIAQAEDNFPQLEEDIAVALGRSAELRGEDGLPNDLMFRAFECERKARVAYARSEPKIRRLAEAYAAGLTDVFSARNRGVVAFEPWVMFATEFRDGAGRDLLSVVDQVAGPKPRRAPRSEPIQALIEQESGSNAWAISPARTTEGNAILFSNPHVGFFGGGQRYEVHLESEEGWRFSGFSILSQPLPHAGHNGRLGWSHTNSGVDTSDQYLLRFDHATNKKAYRHGTTYRDAVTWRDKLRVLVDGELQEREYEFTKSHLGPIVGRSGSRLIAQRTARSEEGGYWRQKYAMGKARTLKEFKSALELRAITGSNTTYADAEGNIAFWYGNCIPKRDPSLNWSEPVDALDPRSEWKGYHPLSEVPQVINPPEGWLQNCNSSFETTTLKSSPKEEAYPPYMRGDSDGNRAKNSRRILASKDRFSYEELSRLAFDTYVFSAAERVPLLLAAVEEKPQLQEPLNELKRWDYRSSVHSVPMTLYMLSETMAAQGQQRLRALPDAKELASGFEQALKGLEEHYGTWRVPWGVVNRLQRPDTFGRAGFDQTARSLPVPGASGGTGIIFAFYQRPSKDPFEMQFGVMGNTYVSLVQFGEKPRAQSIVTFGQSGDPRSPHYFDQAPLFTRGRFKTAWFEKDEVLRSLRKRSIVQKQPDRVPGLHLQNG